MTAYFVGFSIFNLIYSCVSKSLAYETLKTIIFSWSLYRSSDKCAANDYIGSRGGYHSL